MDEPETLTHNGPPATRRRSRRASTTGSVVDIAGLSLSVRATGDAHQHALETLFGSLAPCPRAPVAQLVFDRSAIAMPRRPADKEYPDVHVWHDGDTLSLRSDHYGMRARVTPSLARVSCAAPPRPSGLRSLFRHISTHMLAHHGAYVVHGGAVRRGDFAALVLGNSGAGKSTLALAALEHGWSVMADDLVAIRLDGDRVRIQGVPKPLALPGDLEASVLADAPTLDWDYRRRRHLAGEHIDTAAVALSQVLLVGHGEGEHAGLAPIPRAELASLLLSSFASTDDAPLLRRFFPVAIATARMPCAMLLHAENPEVRLTEAARALQQLADAG